MIMRRRKILSCQRVATAAAVSLAVSALPVMGAIAIDPTTAGAYNGANGVVGVNGGAGGNGTQSASAVASSTDQGNTAIATGGTGGAGLSGTAIGGHANGAA